MKKMKKNNCVAYHITMGIDISLQGLVRKISQDNGFSYDAKCASLGQ